MRPKHYEHEQQPIEPAAWPEQSIPAWSHPLSRAYLISRGLSREECETYDLHYVETGDWQHRLLIPIYADGGELVCFQGRILDPHYTGRAKYRTAGPRTLYQPWDVPHGSVLCVVEGPFDLFAVQRVTSTVAVLGVNPSEDQTLALRQLIERFPWSAVALWYDPDAMWNGYLIQSLLLPHTNVPVEVVVYTDEKDPGECSPEQITAVIASVSTGDA